MRALLAVAVILAFSGCLRDDAPASATVAASPAAACDARGLGPSCATFCALHEATCRLPERPAVPYPTLAPEAVAEARDVPVAALSACEQIPGAICGVAGLR